MNSTYPINLKITYYKAGLKLTLIVSYVTIIRKTDKILSFFFCKFEHQQP